MAVAIRPTSSKTKIKVFNRPVDASGSIRSLVFQKIYLVSIREDAGGHE